MSIILSLYTRVPSAPEFSAPHNGMKYLFHVPHEYIMYNIENLKHINKNKSTTQCYFVTGDK